MKLTKENMQFIDTYLENSDVVYVDIRLEMVDHIATGVEEKMRSEQIDFYDAFKDYMVVHKKSILKNNKRRYSYSWESIKQFLLFLVKPYMLFLNVALFFFFKKIDVNRYFNEDFTVNNMFSGLIIVLFLFQIVYLEFILKKRFYIAERNIVVLVTLYYLQVFLLPVYCNNDVSIYTITIFSFLFLGYIIFLAKEIIKFNSYMLNYI